MAGSKRGRHSAALTRMLRSTGLLNVPEEAMLVELLRDLAAEMDAGGGARTRLAYLSALKDLRRVLGGSTSARPVRGTAESAASKPAAVETPVDESGDKPTTTPNELAEFKQRKGIPA